MNLMKTLRKYFTSGLLFLLPLWIVYIIIKSLSGVITNMVDINVLYGFVLAVLGITAVGFIVRRIVKHYIGKHIVHWSQKPGAVGFCMRRFMQIDDISEKARTAFRNPILYKVDDGIYKIGFITDNDIDILDGIESSSSSETNPSHESVWVYTPLPVTMLGDLALIEKRKIQKLSKDQEESVPLFVFSAGLIEQ